MHFRGARHRRRRLWLVAPVAVIGVVAVLAAVSALSRSDQGATSTPPPSAAAAATPGPQQTPLVLTYFYYWYDLPNGPHSGALTDRPADPNTSYKRVDWFKQQLSDMHDAGIDVALAVYWGNEEPSSDAGLVNLGRAAAEMDAAGQPHPLVGMFFDTGVIGRWPPPQRDFTGVENQKRVYDLVHRFFTILPRTQWAYIGGRPVISFWGQYFDISFGQPFFDYLYSRFQADFGVRPYIVADVSWRFPNQAGRPQRFDRPVAIDDFYGWGAALNGMSDGGGNIVEVGPGYDERQLTGPGREEKRHADREGGAFYERNLAAAVRSGKRFLAIETWDEFHEATDIADSVQYGRRYIEITRRYAAAFKAAQPARSH